MVSMCVVVHMLLCDMLAQVSSRERKDFYTRMWIHWWSHMTYLGQVQQNGGGFQQLQSCCPCLICRWGVAMMFLHCTYGPVPRYSPLHEVGWHRTGVELQSLPVWTQHQHDYNQEQYSIQREATLPVSISALLAQQSGHCPLWGVGLKWRGRGNSVK